MPPINLYSLPSQDWFDKLWAKPHSKDTANRTSVARVVKQPHQLMRGR